MAERHAMMTKVCMTMPKTAGAGICRRKEKRLPRKEFQEWIFEPFCL